MFNKILTILLFCCGGISLSWAQNDCLHQLLLNDAFGNGWEGAELTVSINGIGSTYSLDGINDDGFERIFDIAVVEGDLVDIEYSVGSGDEIENSFRFIDSDGQVLFQSENGPDEDVLFSEFVLCPICPSLVLESYEIVDIFAFTAEIDWEPSDSMGTYIINYQECGDTTTLVEASTVNSEFTFTGLEENTCYEFDLFLICSQGDSSIVVQDEFQTIWDADVGISGVVTPFDGQKCIFTGSDTLEVLIKNYGASPRSFINFDFTINGKASGVNMPQDGLYTGVIGKDSCHNVPFLTGIDVSQPGLYEFEIWTDLFDPLSMEKIDSDLSNDTFYYSFIHTYEIPFKENFSNTMLPDAWTSNSASPVYPIGDHQNNSAVLANFMNDLSAYFVFNTSRYGIVSEGEEFYYSYRTIQINGAGNASGYFMGEDDELLVEISTDCGETWNIIDQINSDIGGHIPSTNLTPRVISLVDYEGESVEFRFTTTRGSSDFWIDFDDIEMLGCTGEIIDASNEDSFDIQANTSSASPNGSINLVSLAGLEPFTFLWSNGSTNNPINNLAAGIYDVTITDAGCREQVAMFEVPDLTNSLEIESLNNILIYPVPASDDLNIILELSAIESIDVQVFNTMGQMVKHHSNEASSDHNIRLNVSNLESGVYYVNISTGEGQINRKIIVE